MNNANSQRLAEHVLEEISGLGIPKRKAYSKVSNNNPSQDYYFMLRRTRPITSVIVECLFIDNVEDVKFLSGPQALQNLASAIGRGVLDYFNLNGNIVKTPIMGKAVATADQMEKYLHSINIDAPYYAKIYLAEGAKEGVRGDIAFAQSLHETNYFRFGGNVSSAQNNFAGIGSTGAGVNGASFETPEEGIRAQIQHLKAYASKDPLNGQKVDPRFDLIKRGSAPNVEDLDGKWAVPGIGYGRSIIDILDKILADVVKQDDWAKPYMDNLKTLGIIQDPHNQDDPVKWGELAAVITRTIENLKGK